MIFSGLTSKIFGATSIALALFAALCWFKWGTWKDKAENLQAAASSVVEALKIASDNPKADWKTAPGQIIALGESNRALKGEIRATNEAINEMAAEAVRLRAKASELQAIARKAEAQRRAAYARLSNMAITPGTRADCMTLLREAEEALDLVKEAGL